jgi:hypothetical protein
MDLERSQNKYKLFIDELGTADIKDKNSKVYILAGCSIKEDERMNMKIWADQIKFKYWGNTKIVFHSREIGRKENNFAILKDKSIFNEFLRDLEKFLLDSNFRMFFVIINKEKAGKLTWNNLKIYKETSFWLVRNFLLILLTNESKGKIVIESSTAEKDFYFHKAISFFLAPPGIPNLSVDYKKIRDTLTSFSFVTKDNCDIEEQVADLFAYAAKCKYLLKNKEKLKIGNYEKMMLNLLDKKLYKVPKNAKDKKMKYFKEVESFLVLPI